VRRRALIYGVPLLTLVVLELWIAQPPAGSAVVPTTLLHGLEVAYAALRGFWTLFLIQSWCAFWFGRVIVRQSTAPQLRDSPLST